jgi:NAD(P)H-hydrate epimerase
MLKNKPISRHLKFFWSAKMHKPSPEPIRYFVTDSGVEVPAVTTGQMIEVDRIAVEKTGPNLYQMMENAGRNLAELALQIWGKKFDEKSVVVLAGNGGNSGGGICAARHLANRNVEVNLCLARPGRLGGIPRFQRQIFQWTSGREVEITMLEELYPDLIIDALIGYNLTSLPQGAIADIIEWANVNSAPILSLDVPSGIDATSGEAHGVYIRPQWTMTLALPKTGLTPERTGDLWLADIGIPEEVYRRIGIRYDSPFGNRFRVPLSVA